MNGVLVTKPIRTLDCVIHVPAPVILCHVTQRSIDTALGSDCVRARGEQLCNTRRVQTALCKTEGSAQSGTASTDDNGIVLVLNHRVAF